MAVHALPTSVVLAAGNNTSTATVSAADGAFHLDTEDALELEVTLMDSEGEELPLLRGESLALEFLGDGTAATLIGTADSLPIR
jgi:hypothetical protein